jgi:hypothetical protein
VFNLCLIIIEYKDKVFGVGCEMTSLKSRNVDGNVNAFQIVGNIILHHLNCDRLDHEKCY